MYIYTNIYIYKRTVFEKTSFRSVWVNRRIFFAFIADIRRSESFSSSQYNCHGTPATSVVDISRKRHDSDRDLLLTIFYKTFKNTLHSSPTVTDGATAAVHAEEFIKGKLNAPGSIYRVVFCALSLRRGVLACKHTQCTRSVIVKVFKKRMCPEELILRAPDVGQTPLARTDHSSLRVSRVFPSHIVLGFKTPTSDHHRRRHRCPLLFGGA